MKRKELRARVLTFRLYKVIACEASVSMEFSALKTRIQYFWTRAKWGESKKTEEGGGGGRGEERRGRKRLPATPTILHNVFAHKRGVLIGVDGIDICQPLVNITHLPKEITVAS